MVSSQHKNTRKRNTRFVRVVRGGDGEFDGYQQDAAISWRWTSAGAERWPTRRSGAKCLHIGRGGDASRSSPEYVQQRTT